MTLGSGDPTRLICSALIAQAFEVVRYPILPKVTASKAGQHGAIFSKSATARSMHRAISTSRPISQW
jgi:hypothetical protein